MTKICVLYWLSNSTDSHSLILWHDLKRAVQSRPPQNIEELKHVIWRNGVKFLLINVLVLSAPTGTVYWRFLLLKEDIQVTKFKGLLTLLIISKGWPILFFCLCFNTIMRKKIIKRSKTGAHLFILFISLEAHYDPELRLFPVSIWVPSRFSRFPVTSQKQHSRGTNQDKLSLDVNKCMNVFFYGLTPYSVYSCLILRNSWINSFHFILI